MLRWFHPSHRKHEVDADNYAVFLGFLWDNIGKGSNLGRLEGAAVVGICNIQLGYLDRPRTGFASHIVWRMRGKAYPNYIDSRAISLTMVSFTFGIPLSVCANKSRMSRGCWCSWGTAAIRDILKFFPNNLTASDAGKRILNPPCNRLCNSLRMKAVISVLHAEVWGSFAMARSLELRGQADPVCTRMQLSTYSYSRGAARCWNDYGSALLLWGNEVSQGGVLLKRFHRV